MTLVDTNLFGVVGTSKDDVVPKGMELLRESPVGEAGRVEILGIGEPDNS